MKRIPLVVDEGLILGAPVVETLLKLLIAGVACVALPASNREGSTARRFTEVVKVSNNIQAKRTRVASNVGNTFANLEVAEAKLGVGRAARRQPDFGGGMTVAEDDGRETRDRVVGMSETELKALSGRHVIGKDVVADTGRAKGVQVASVSISTEISGGNDSNSTSEGVTGDNQAVALVLIETRANKVVDGGRDFIPSIRETRVHLASRAELAARLGKNDVRDEVADVVTAANRHDNLTATVVDRHVRRNTGVAARCAAYGVDGITFNIVAVALALDAVSAVDARVAIRSSSMLGVELEVVKVGLRNTN